MPDDPLTAEAVRLYAENKSMYDIGTELGIAEYTVKRILVAAGVPIRKKGGITGKKKKKFYRYT